MSSCHSFVRRTFALLMLATVGVSPTGYSAGSPPPPLPPDQIGAWPTPEQRAFATSREAAAQVYIACLRGALQADDALSAPEARVMCTEAGKQYAQWLPAERVEEILDTTVFQAKAHP